MRRRSNTARHHWRLLLHPSVDNDNNVVVIALNMDGHSGVLWFSQLERSCNQLKHNQNNVLNCYYLLHLKLWPPSLQRIVRNGFPRLWPHNAIIHQSRKEYIMSFTLESQLHEIRPCFDAIQTARGKAKEPEILACAQSPAAFSALKLLLDPMVVFHVQRRSLEKNLNITLASYWDDLFTMCEYLSGLRAADMQVLAKLQYTLSNIADPALREFLVRFLCKDIPLGISAKTVNRVLGRTVIPVYECMLAEKYFEHPEAVEGKRFALTEKLDGVRCQCVAEKGKSPRFYTRQGQPIEGLVELEDDILTLTDSGALGFVLDGELLIADRENIPSKEQYKRTVQVVRRDGEKRGVVFNAFDIVDYSVFLNHDCTTPYYLRRQELEAIVHDVEHIKVVPVLYVGGDANEILRHLEIQRGLNHEGVMINLLDAPYEFKRTRNLLKVKAMQDCDLAITGVEEGGGRFKGTLGALVVDFKGNPVRVGSGMTDSFRREVWANPSQFIGRVATVQYFEVTQDKSGVESLRFPVFKDLREPGKEVSYY